MMGLSQLSMLTGVKAVADRTSNNLIYQSWQVLSQVSDAHPGAILISALVIGGAFATAYFAPRAPAPLFGVAFAVAVAFAVGIREKEVGRLPFEIPPFAAF